MFSNYWTPAGKLPMLFKATKNTNSKIYVQALMSTTIFTFSEAWQKLTLAQPKDVDI